MIGAKHCEMVRFFQSVVKKMTCDLERLKNIKSHGTVGKQIVKLDAQFKLAEEINVNNSTLTFEINKNLLKDYNDFLE